GSNLGYAQMATAAGLKAIAGYAAGVGPEKTYVIPRDAKGNLGQPTDFVPNAHAAGLKVHPYTFRAENAFLPTDLRQGSSVADRGDIEAEIRAYLDAGIDGLFIDQPDIAVKARETK
ncbi:MAG TPA: glycerophosphodiester phosphodiesterase, partial [Pseudomonas nitrititolerans]|nr:glycerophosphodiester phosphodiesterase [Stutzerimonas nitrititolerans]